MEFRPFGQTGLIVSAIGFGAGHIGNPEMDERTASNLLNAVLDTGVNLIDTARSYGSSERRIGQHISHRRQEFILSTKVGYTFQDKPDWSYDATIGTIEEALQLLRTDYLDIVHLHSCDKWVLEQGDSVKALEHAKAQGKVRFIAYSGENEALGIAIGSHRFDSIQCSVNVFDQHGIDKYLPSAMETGMGIIAKRPLGNAVWRYANRPDGHGHAAYWDRMKQMSLGFEADDWHDLALRFSLYSSGVDTAIVGTSNIDNFTNNLKIIEKGPLDDGLRQEIMDEFRKHIQNRDGLI